MIFGFITRALIKILEVSRSDVYDYIVIEDRPPAFWVLAVLVFKRMKRPPNNDKF
jgi:hypothetical protein